jgi:hypothetical protein
MAHFHHYSTNIVNKMLFQTLQMAARNTVIDAALAMLFTAICHAEFVQLLHKMSYVERDFWPTFCFFSASGGVEAAAAGRVAGTLPSAAVPAQSHHKNRHSVCALYRQHVDAQSVLMQANGQSH